MNKKISTQPSLGKLAEVPAVKRSEKQQGRTAEREGVRRAAKKYWEQRQLIGEMFGRLYVERLAETRRLSPLHSQRYWDCRCLCGGRVVVRTGALLSGHTKSCGCLQRESVANRNRRMKGAGISPQMKPLYNIWQQMKQRCYNPNAGYYHRYGGRGIRVCERWLSSFVNFSADIGPRPSPKHSLDRINNNGNYEPGNVRWATQKEQCANRECSVHAKSR